MPELPEVETIVRTLSPLVAERYISSIDLLHDKSLQYGKERLPLLEGAKISRVFRRAKLLLMDVEPKVGKPLLAVFHLKMTGKFFLHPDGTEPLKHTRIAFTLLKDKSRPEGTRLFFDDIRTFGYCRIMFPEELVDWPFWKELGPEPLETSPQLLAVRFKQRSGAIKAVLLDQRVVAGVGNIYADECLFRAGIAPSAKASQLSVHRLEKLASALQDVLKQSIEECGSSIRDYRDAKGDAGAFQNNFFVYGRKGEACKVCAEPLEDTRVAGRGTVFCPACQKS